jgi:hypothetical protein
MELDELKSSWQSAGGAFKIEADILTMTRISNHPSLKRIRRKLVFEAIILAFMLVVYYDWFDGDKKPVYANVLLVSSLLLYIINDIVGYISMLNPVSGINIKDSIKNYLIRIKRLAICSLLVSFLYSVCLILFFTSVIKFTKEKNFILLAMFIILTQLMLWSYRVWRNRIRSLSDQVKELEPGDEKLL